MTKDEQIEMLRAYILKIMDEKTAPPFVMMEPQEMVKKYNALVREHGKFKRLFWKIYYIRGEKT